MESVEASENGNVEAKTELDEKKGDDEEQKDETKEEAKEKKHETKENIRKLKIGLIHWLLPHSAPSWIFS